MCFFFCETRHLYSVTHTKTNMMPQMVSYTERQHLNLFGNGLALVNTCWWLYETSVINIDHWLMSTN